MLGTPKRDRVAERREATRREILDAAWELAREVGLAGITLRAVAARVGMQAPSLYTHFDSKNAIYDAMFAAAWTEFFEVRTAIVLPAAPRAALRTIAGTFVDFAVADPTRYELMNRRTIPGFEPSPEAYRPAVASLETLRAALAQIGVHDDIGLDLATALIGGVVDQQLANDPGGERWLRLLDRAIDMYADAMGLPRTE